MKKNETKIIKSYEEYLAKYFPNENKNIDKDLFDIPSKFATHLAESSMKKINSIISANTNS